MSRSLAAVAALVVAVAGARAVSPGREPILPTVSPDGGHVAWADGGTWRIWVARAGGGGAHVFGPSFKSKGIGQITWTRFGIVVDSGLRFFLLSQRGRSTLIGPAGDLAFSVGGAHVASASSGCGICSGTVTIVDLRTRRAVRVGAPNEPAKSPSLSPDGRLVAWAGLSGVWVATASGRHARQVAPGGHCPEWSPDGRSIAYVSFLDDTLRVIPARGGRSRVLAVRAGSCSAPDAPGWSPDSSRLAFARGTALVVVAVTTRRAVTAPKQLGPVVGGFAWSRDGSALYVAARPRAVAATRETCTVLWRLDARTLRGTMIANGCP